MTILVNQSILQYHALNKHLKGSQLWRQTKVGDKLVYGTSSSKSSLGGTFLTIEDRDKLDSWLYVCFS